MFVIVIIIFTLANDKKVQNPNNYRGQSLMYFTPALTNLSRSHQFQFKNLQSNLN